LNVSQSQKCSFRATKLAFLFNRNVQPRTKYTHSNTLFPNALGIDKEYFHFAAYLIEIGLFKCSNLSWAMLEKFCNNKSVNSLRDHDFDQELSDEQVPALWRAVTRSKFSPERKAIEVRYLMAIAMQQSECFIPINGAKPPSVDPVSFKFCNNGLVTYLLPSCRHDLNTQFNLPLSSRETSLINQAFNGENNKLIAFMLKNGARVRLDDLSWYNVLKIFILLLLIYFLGCFYFSKKKF
jgi:hypothetical protein